MITCPTCKSSHWECLDESTIQCIDPRTNEEYTSPIGFMRCKDCGARWSDGGCDGSDREIDDAEHEEGIPW